VLAVPSAHLECSGLPAFPNRQRLSIIRTTVITNKRLLNLPCVTTCRIYVMNLGIATSIRKGGQNNVIKVYRDFIKISQQAFSKWYSRRGISYESERTPPILQYPRYMQYDQLLSKHSCWSTIELQFYLARLYTDNSWNPSGG
jgi:hypothetical protein